MKINFKGKKVDLRFSLRSHLMYENAVGESFSGVKGYTETVTFFYCVLVVSLGDYSISLDDVIDWLDDNKHVLPEFTEWLVKEIEQQYTLKKNLKTRTTTPMNQ